MRNRRPGAPAVADFDPETPRPRDCGGCFESWKDLHEGKGQTTMALAGMSYIAMRAAVVAICASYLLCTQ